MQCIKLSTDILQNSAKGTKQNPHLVTQFNLAIKRENMLLAKKMKEKLDNEVGPKNRSNNMRQLILKYRSNNMVLFGYILRIPKNRIESIPKPAFFLLQNRK